ncbi:MAG: alpha/beta hydrolase [Bacteroidota bacterium]
MKLSLFSFCSIFISLCLILTACQNTSSDKTTETQKTSQTPVKSSPFTSFDGTKIAFTDEGTGHPVVLIHGFMNTRKNWDNTELKTELLYQGFRVIALDLRGNGDSDHPKTADAYDDNAEVKDVMGLVEYLELESYSVVGYSRGGIIAAELLTEDTRINKGVIGGMGLDFTNPNWPKRIAFAKAFGGEEAPTALTEGAVNYAKSKNLDLEILSLQQYFQPAPSVEELRKINIPVMVIAGHQDQENGKAGELHQVIPNSTLSSVPGTHNTAYRKQAFGKSVARFLSKK